ncbi:ABC transporter permease [Fulvivirga sp. M361]|uniref:ABC transporter permease n=1 Tax=Fulvivirga sp. M361 TaxID=2594266 RepID=UPI001179FCBB|nr:ABC transporter permease [Fulvivirga sp. M361]TRX52206.1 ABC transporter permease [Fulvivirga sp. M361]
MKNQLRHIVLIFVLSPFLTVVYLSLVSGWSFPDLWQANFTLRFWKSLLESGSGLLDSLRLSLFISFSIALLATAFGFFVSKQLMFWQRYQALLQLAFYPYLIAPVILGAMLQYYFVRWGLTGTLLGVFLAQTLFVLPYSVLLMATFWTDRIRQIAFQASSLGASNRQVNASVLFPMARSWLLLCFVQCFLISWFEYGITRLIGVGKVDTLTIKVMHFVQEANPHYAALAACLMILPLLVVLVINQRLITNRNPNPL